MKKLVCILILFLMCVSAVSVHAEETPAEVVDAWEACYGTAEMDQCGEIVTAKMRDDKPISVWVYDAWKALDRIKYRKEQSEVLKEEIDEMTAIVVLQARIYALDGYVDQKELYRLWKIDGEWFIDGIIIGDEILEEEQEES